MHNQTCLKYLGCFFWSKGLGEWINGCVWFAQLWHLSVMVKYYQTNPLEEDETFFLVQHFTLVQMAFTKALDTGFLRLHINFFTLLKPLASPRPSFTQKSFLLHETCKDFIIFLKDFLFWTFSGHRVSLWFDTLLLLDFTYLSDLKSVVV